MISGKLSDQIEIINKILSDKKLMSSKNIESKIYTDQPIIMKASHMSGFMPEKYNEMKAVATDPANFSRSDSWIFAEQGRIMEDFEDDYVFNGNVVRYFPTYKSLTDSELRGYFSWRTKVRRCIFEKTSLTFAYIYFYELLNLIGCKDPADAFEKMNDFVIRYSEIDNEILKYAKMWIFDFVIFYGLDISFLNRIYDFSREKALEKLLSYNDIEDEELFEATALLSSYNIKNSRLYKLYPKELCKVVSRVYKAYALHCDKKCEKSLHIRLFGYSIETAYNMMFNAVFYGRNKHADCDYTISSVHKYCCRAGMWKCTRYIGLSENSSNKHLGMILKAVDRILRKKLGVFPDLACGKEPKMLVSIIEKESDMVIAEKKSAESKKIEIDLSKLEGIRLAASVTMEKLIVDEETDEIETIGINNAVVGDMNTEMIDEDALPLDHDEYEFLLKLLNDDGACEYALSKGLMISVISDSINEKIFDYFGDSVIDFDSDQPCIVDEYRQELLSMLKGKQE